MIPSIGNKMLMKNPFVAIDSLLAYFKLNQNTNDSTGGFDGTAYGSLSYSVSGLINYCGVFNGSNSYIEGAFDYSGTEYTISAWVKTSSADTRGVAGFTDSSGYRREIYIISGALRVFVPNEYVTASSGTLNNNSWHHIVGGYDGASSFMYVDGNSVTGLSASYTTAQTADIFRIGHIMTSSISSSYIFNGEIDEVGIWGKALSESEILELYNNGDGLPYPFSS